jgi:hypothetical protein
LALRALRARVEPDRMLACEIHTQGYWSQLRGEDGRPYCTGSLMTEPLALRQALAMSAGSYAIFVTRPISVALLAIGAVLVCLALRPLLSRTLDWRAHLPPETAP